MTCAAGKVLIPTSHFIRTLVAARLAADVAEVRPGVITLSCHLHQTCARGVL